MSMVIVDVLTKARALIEDETHHTRNALARDADGNEVGPTEPNAFCWCAGGAIHCVARMRDQRIEAKRLLNAASEELFDKVFLYVNDLIGHAAILRCFDLAI